MIKLDISTTFWISNLINDTVLCFLNTTLIEKIIFLFENPFIFFTTAKMLLISFTSQTSLFLNPMSILVQFLAVNAMTSAQILPKTLPRFSKHWNLDKVSVALMRNRNKILLRSILSPSSLALSNLALSSPTSSSCLSNSQTLNCASSH